MRIAMWVTNKLFPDGFGTRTLVTCALVALVGYALVKILGTPVLAESLGETILGAVIALSSAMVSFWAQGRQNNNGPGA